MKLKGMKESEVEKQEVVVERGMLEKEMGGIIVKGNHIV